MVSLWKARRCHGNSGQSILQEEAGEQLAPPLGDSYALARILLQDFHSSRFTRVPPATPPPSFRIRPFYLYPSLYSLEFLELHFFFLSCDSNPGGGPYVYTPLKMWFPVQLNWLIARPFMSCTLQGLSETH